MASEKRESNNSLEDRLFKEFYSFSFFKAVSLLDLLFPHKKPLGETLSPSQEVVRFSVRPGFTFPPSDISNLRYADQEKPVDMEVTFMGLIGPSGILPHWYNELAVQRNREGDFGLTSFLDIFHHRLISLFYLAWKRYRFPENYLPGAKDRLSWCMLNLLGLGTQGLADRIGFPRESLIFCSGLLSRPVPSAMALERAIGYFSATKVEIQQFIERMLPLSPEDQSQLGSANSRLGVDTICGSHIFERQTRFRVNLGPMDYKEFLKYMPTGPMICPIFSLIRYMAGIEFEFEIRVFLKREEIPPCVLGTEGPTSPRLGLSTWIKSPGLILDEDPYVTFEES